MLFDCVMLAMIVLRNFYLVVACFESSQAGKYILRYFSNWLNILFLEPIAGIFRPILSAKTACFKDLREAIRVELTKSSSNSYHLCKKLKACNKEAHGLRQYFLGVANRMYKDNDQIAGILKSGKYHFSLSEDGCFLVLNCSNADPSQPESSRPLASSQGARSYTLAQLQELRSRARWTISSNTYVKKSKTAQAFGTTDLT